MEKHEAPELKKKKSANEKLMERIMDIIYKNLKDSFDLDYEEIEKDYPRREIATSCVQVLEEGLQRGQHQNANIEGRMVIHMTEESIRKKIERMNNAFG